MYIGKRSTTNRRRQKRQNGSIYLLSMSILATLTAILSITNGIINPEDFQFGKEAEVVEEPTYQAVTLAAYSYDDLDLSALVDINTQVVYTKDIEDMEETLSYETTRTSGISVVGYDADTDYQTSINRIMEMIDAFPEEAEMLLAVAEVYELQRNLKISDSETLSEKFETTFLFNVDNTYEDIDNYLNPTYYDYTDEDLYRLAAIVYAEAGTYFMTDEHQQDVASVVVNRMEDTRFASTISSVIDSPGQYPDTKDSRYYDERSLENAQYVLENGPSTTGIYQANFKQGSTVLATYDYAGVSTTYICE